jgi:hypothetical protein
MHSTRGVVWLATSLLLHLACIAATTGYEDHSLNADGLCENVHVEMTRARTTALLLRSPNYKRQSPGVPSSREQFMSASDMRRCSWHVQAPSGYLLQLT